MSISKYKSLLAPAQSVTEEQLETERNLLAFEKTISPLSRRSFFSGIAGAAALAAVSGGQRASAQTTTPNTTQILEVLNFALNLEYLEANFYLYASTGSGLPSANTAGGVTPENPPLGITFDANTLSVIQALARDEMNHIALLQSAISSLGGTPIPQPLINYGAKGAITTQAQFLTVTRQFTAVGNSAYAGGAQLLVSSPSVLTTAAQILGAEGQHMGAVNYLCVTQGIVSPAVDAQDVPASSTNYITALPTTALSPARTPAQVLGIAYGVSTPATTTPPTGVTVGGFFPNGVNGAITST